MITKIGTKEFFRFVEIFSNEESRDEADFPYIDVTYEYRANIRGASEEDYDIYTCKVDTIKVNYTTLETEGELEYKTSATRTVNVTSNDGISGLKYCTTNGMNRRSYSATYVSKTCTGKKNCRTEEYCTESYSCDPWYCPDWGSSCVQQYGGSTQCGCYQIFGSTCCDKYAERTVCDSYTYECGNYTCPNGGILSRTTCVF